MTPTPIVDANVWVAAYDATDRFHADSAAFLSALANLGIGARAPAILVLEVACALARRFGDASVGREVAAKLEEHTMLRMEPLDSCLLLEAARLDAANRLRAGAVTPLVWLSAHA